MEMDLKLQGVLSIHCTTVETPLAPNEGMEKKGPGRVNCCPLKDINAYAGGSSLFLLWCCPALPIFYMNESVKWRNQSKQFLLNKLPDTIRLLQQNLGKR